MSERGFVEEEVRKMSKTEDDDGAGRFLKGLFEDRLTATMKIRSCLEKIVEDQRNEELVYKEFIDKSVSNPPGGFLSGDSESSSFNPGEIALLEKRIKVLEEKYHHEFEKRVKLQKAFLNFKTEGNSIIDRLRFALRQVGSKYKKERLKNRHLTKRLNEQLLNQNEIGEEEKFRKLKQLLQATSNELQKYKVQFNRVEDKFVSYKRMVVDHKKVIAALRKKLERYQEENEHLRKQASSLPSSRAQQQRGYLSPPYRDRPTQDELSPMLRAQGEDSQDQSEENSESDGSSSEDDGEDEIDLKSRLRKYGVEESGDEDEDLEEDEEYEDDDDDELEIIGKKKSAKAVVKDQQALIKKLLDRLETEEDQRLKTEEQSYKIVEEEERTISFLESQIKNLTNSSLLNDKGEEEEEDGDGGGLDGMSPIKDIVE